MISREEHPEPPLKSPAGASTYRDNLLLAGVDDAHLLVLAGGAEQAAVAAPADAKDHVGVHVLQADHGLPRAHIPNDDLVVAPLNGHMQHRMTTHTHTHTSVSKVILSPPPYTKRHDRGRPVR